MALAISRVSAPKGESSGAVGRWGLCWLRLGLSVASSGGLAVILGCVVRFSTLVCESVEGLAVEHAHQPVARAGVQ